MRKTHRLGQATGCHLCGRIVMIVRSGASGKLARHKCPHGTWCQAGGKGCWSKRRSTICPGCRAENPQKQA